MFRQRRCREEKSVDAGGRSGLATCEKCSQAVVCRGGWAVHRMGFGKDEVERGVGKTEKLSWGRAHYQKILPTFLISFLSLNPGTHRG